MACTATDEHPADGPAPGPPDPRAVDADVAGAVGRVLDGELRERVAAATAVDAVFARDVAERVARFTLDGGKRLRAQFLWWALRACGGGTSDEQVRAALSLAAALELVQTCALVHDDVMDGSALRRGAPSVHCALDAQYEAPRHRAGDAPESFGRAAAVLVGDLALAWADDTTAATPLPTGIRHTVHGIWRAMRTEMVAGQYLDLHGQATGARSTAQAIRTARLKSALYSVERPLALGAAVAGADAPATRALCRAGRCAGIAFQLRDDLLGVFGDPAATGKASGEDIREGKPNYLVAVARRQAATVGDRHAALALDDLVGAADLSDGDLDRVRDVLVATGAREVVETRIAGLVDQSTRHLAAAVARDHPAHARLVGLFHRAAGLPPPGPGERPGPPVTAGGETRWDGGETR